jgi:hypothetical protein
MRCEVPTALLVKSQIFCDMPYDAMSAGKYLVISDEPHVQGLTVPEDCSDLEYGDRKLL